jgi:CAAX amino terminal protease family.
MTATADSGVTPMWGLLLVAVLLGAVILAAGVAVALAIWLLGVAGIAADGPLGLALVSVAQFTGFGVVAWWFLRIKAVEGVLHRLWPTWADLRWVGVGIAVLLGFFLAANWLLQLLSIEGAESVLATQGAQQPVYYLYLIPVTIILVGPIEELVFRGIIQGLLRESLGTVPAIAAASVIFAGVHVGAYTGGGLGATLVFIAGLGAVLGVLYEWSQSLAVVAVVHGLFNAVQFAGLYLVSTGVL